MKKTAAKILFFVILMVTLGLCVTACADTRQRPFDHLVTFDYNIGTLDANCENQFLGVDDGALIGIVPGYGPTFKPQSIINYYNEGWYLPKTDSAGEPIVGDDQRVELLRKWDFAVDRVTADVTLYANFVPQPTLTIKIDGGTDIVDRGEPGSIKEQPSSVFQPKKDGHTFYGYFEDQAATIPFAWPYTYGTADKTIFAVFIEGSWTIVRTAAQFNSAIATNPNGKIYVDSDLSFAQTDWVSGREFGGEINGNGHSFTDISVQFEGKKTTQTHFGLFGILKSTALIHDLQIVDAQAVFSDVFVWYDYSAALFAWQIDAGARLQNVSVSGRISEGQLSSGTSVALSGFCSFDYGAVVSGCDFSGIVIGDTL